MNFALLAADTGKQATSNGNNPTSTQWVLIVIGLIAVAAAAPAAAQRYSGGGIHVAPLYYFYRQIVWIALAVPVMIAVSMLAKPTARRLSILGAAVFTLFLFLVPILGFEVNGARRWLDVGVTQFQPSEFLKPMFIVTIAWLLSLKEKDKSLPVVPLSAVLTGVIALLLMRQPNLGETVIFVAAWVVLVMLSPRCGFSTRSARPASACSSPLTFSTMSRLSGSTASCSPRETNIRWNRRCAR